MDFLKRLFSRTRSAKTPPHPLQTVAKVPGKNYRTLGSDYGAWTFLDSDALHGSTIVSAGLGEDATFDVEFARAYGARVILVDPTPRAILHFKELAARLGQGRQQDYAEGGKQPADAYDLTGLDDRSLQLVEKALWTSQTQLKFFAPSNPDHVSHSIVNYQNNYAQDTASIEVQAIPLDRLLADLAIDPATVPLIKLDIEGAEIEVIPDILSKGIRPDQFLIEFDNLNIPGEEAYRRVDQAWDHLKNHGYSCIHSDGRSNFLFTRADHTNGA